MSILTIIAIIAVVLVFVVIYIYNSLIVKRNRTQEAWSDIDIQLKRRYDLIPNLINTVKGYAKHEREVLENVTQLRSEALNNQAGAEAQGQSENLLSEALKSLFAVSENYPDLKANQNFIELQKELADTENKIQASRRFYNTTVIDLNNALQSFPQNMIAPYFKFKEEQFFELDEEEAERAKKPVDVKF